MSRRKPGLNTFKPKPKAAKTTPAQPVEVTIEDLSGEGQGVAHVEGKTVFVEGALPGERGLIRIHREHRNYSEARLINLHEASPDREAVRCDALPECGGCQLQHMPYTQQIGYKVQQLKPLLGEAFREAEWAEPLTASPWHYRHRVRLAVVTKGQQFVGLGFRRAHSKQSIAINRCHVMDERLQPVLEQCQAQLSTLPHAHRLQEITLTVDDNNAVAIECHGRSLPTDEQRTLQRWAEEKGWQLWIKGTALTKNAQPLRYRLNETADLSYRPGDFTQVNPEVNRQMIDTAIEWLQPTSEHSLVDFFCGLGNFSLPIAPRLSQVIGYEFDAAMVARANAAAQEQGIGNVQFATADLMQATPIPKQHELAIIDPPRAGAKALCEAISRTPQQLQRLLYVSCNPATLARDAAILQQGGFKSVRVALADMFPQTAHREALALFIKS